MFSYIKHLIKDKFLITKIRNRFIPSVQIAQRQLFHYYQQSAKKNEVPAFADTGFRVFSQFEEDGKLRFIFSVIGMDKKIFVEIGSDDGINSNSASLYFNFGWHGLFIDINPRSVKRGIHFYNKYPIRYVINLSSFALKLPEKIVTGSLKIQVLKEKSVCYP